jgi:biopolymer transport protein ExbD
MLEGIELNLAAMLDMAFQLLMFFILTFNPAQIESQVAAYIPAPEPVTRPKIADKTKTESNNVQQASYSDAVVVTVEGSPAGKIKNLAVGGKFVDDLASLNATIHNAICYQGENCDQLTVQVDANLCYEELMQVVDICTQQKLSRGGSLSKLKLVELRAE